MKMLAAAALLASLAGPLAAAPSLEDRVDEVMLAGFDRPAEALADLRQLRAATPDTPGRERLLLKAEGVVQAQAGRVAEAGQVAERLLLLSREQADPLAGASSNLIRAVVAETAGQLDVAAALAQSALSVVQPACAPSSGAAGVANAAASAGDAATAPTCDWRLLWRALQVLERRALSLGHFAAAREHARAAYDAADAAGDTRRKSLSLSMLGYIAARNGELDDALRTIAQAKRMAGTLGDPVAMARVRLNEARIADARGDVDAGLRATEDAYLLAQRAGARRLEAVLLTNLSDAYVRRQRPADALRAADLALPIVRSFNDLRTELVLVNNTGLAKIGLKRIAEGKQDMARVMEAKAKSGAIADQAVTLREFGEALAAAGDWRGALDLYHRERKLSGEVMATNRGIVIKEMQMRYDAEAKQRSIEIVRRDNALKSEALVNRDLTQRIWLAAVALLLLATALSLLLVRRVRETQRRLEASQARLRVASERDPLTLLANRRHFHAVMDAASHSSAGFAGALLMVDIDHFKHVNDRHGHKAGDIVLVEVARRLLAAVRDGDLVVRWGGEEFLVVAGRLTIEQSDQLAARILASLGDAPIAVDGRAIRISASIGHACYPLPPYGVPVPWAQAINLADMALYSAKSHGRNRAVGLVSASAQDAAALRAIEEDFERAWHEGRVTLRQTPGPGQPA
jgi:diguanylate cyclase (GGDEF)-like protein